MSKDAEQIIAVYERHARDWDMARANRPWIEKPWIDRFVQLLPEEATVLDFGCGSGTPIACHFAKRGLKVTGVDASPTLVSICRNRLLEHDWIVADMRSLALGKRFNGMLAWDSFFHLKHSDQRRMFDVFKENGAASAVLMFNTGTAFGESVGTFRGNPLYHASLDATEYEFLLGKAGFDIINHAIEDPRAGGRTIWLTRLR